MRLFSGKLHKCRVCDSDTSTVFADLGLSPIANDLVKSQEVNTGESFYPLSALVCEDCWLVQLNYSHSKESIFSSEYPYFSSVSTTWLKHAEDYAKNIKIYLNLNSHSKIIEIASNDGYLLKNFRNLSKNILGIEPCKNVAQYAIDINKIPTITEFLTVDVAIKISDSFGKADLVIANNVLAHVPDLRDFVAGIKLLLAREGVVTFEFPHILSLIKKNQFDTIYHEHYSYLSVHAVQNVFKNFGLRIFKVENLETHGGSLRVYACHFEANFSEDASCKEILELEISEGLCNIGTYKKFQEKVQETKRQLLALMIKIKRERKSIVGYGAPAKGNTLLNYCGIGNDFLDFTVDLSPHKQGMYLPGSRIEIKSPDELYRFRPDYILILPWNLKNEIMEQHIKVREWGCKFILPIPTLEII